MAHSIADAKASIRRGVAGVIASDTFMNWFAELKTSDGDVIAINNSFIYRKPLIATSKNQTHLLLSVVKKTLSPRAASVGKVPSLFDPDFKHYSVRAANLPVGDDLDAAIHAELRALGRLAFVLIGELSEVAGEVTVMHSAIKSLRFDPAAASTPGVEQIAPGSHAIVVGRLSDPESSWNAVQPALQKLLGLVPDSLVEAYSTAFDELREEVRLRLRMPERGDARAVDSFISRLRTSVADQRQMYDAALLRYARGGEDAPTALNEAMRIAYNFAGDAIKLVQLLVGIADLKGIVLWSTLKEHFDLAEAFRNLPWTKSHKKPSLARYREIVNGARNRAFHNLLSFDRTIAADLTGIPVHARSLTLLRPYRAGPGSVDFEYDDREMVELLGELTRAPETEVPIAFWKKNATVMEAFEKLLGATEDTLWLLNGLRGSK